MWVGLVVVEIEFDGKEGADGLLVWRDIDRLYRLFLFYDLGFLRCRFVKGAVPDVDVVAAERVFYEVRLAAV